MFNFLIAAISMQASGLPQNFVGLWADPAGRLVMVGTTSYIEYVEGGQWGGAHGIYQAPNTDFVGVWSESKDLYSTSSNVWPNWVTKTRWPKPILEQFTSFKTNPLAVLKADNPRYTGEIRLKALGNALTVEQTDSKGIAYKKFTLNWIGKWADATVSGLYKDKYAELELSERIGSTNWQARGTFSYDGKNYNVEGERLFSRGRLNLIDPKYGSVVGFLVYGYTPSATQVKKFRSSGFSETDTVFVNFVVPGSPTIQSRVLTK